MLVVCSGRTEALPYYHEDEREDAIEDHDGSTVASTVAAGKKKVNPVSTLEAGRMGLARHVQMDLLRYDNLSDECWVHGR